MIERTIKEIVVSLGAVVLTAVQIVLINYISSEPLNLDFYDYLIVYLLNSIGLLIGREHE